VTSNIVIITACKFWIPIRYPTTCLTSDMKQHCINNRNSFISDCSASTLLACMSSSGTSHTSCSIITLFYCCWTCFVSATLIRRFKTAPESLVTLHCRHSSTQTGSRIITSLTAWITVLKTLIVTQLVNKFPTCYQTQIFITLFTAVYHSTHIPSQLN
jgi:hypothetical protein